MERWMEEEVIWEDSMGLSWTDRNLMKSLRARCEGRYDNASCQCDEHTVWRRMKSIIHIKYIKCGFITLRNEWNSHQTFVLNFGCVFSIDLFTLLPLLRCSLVLKREDGGKLNVWECTQMHRRHSDIVCAQDHPLAPPLLEDKSGQGFLHHASLKIAHSLMPPQPGGALAIWFIS